MSSETHQSHHLDRCQAIGINSFFYLCFLSLSFLITFVALNKFIMIINIPWPYLLFSKNQSGTFFSVYGRRATASSHISCDLKWSGIILNDHGWLHMHCNTTHLLRQETIRDRLQYPWIFFNGFSTHLLSFKVVRNKRE